jgi:hypothetical protein
MGDGRGDDNGEVLTVHYIALDYLHTLLENQRGIKSTLCHATHHTRHLPSTHYTFHTQHHCMHRHTRTKCHQGTYNQ